MTAPETPATDNAPPERAKTIMIIILFVINMGFLALFTFYQPPDPDFTILQQELQSNIKTEKALNIMYRDIEKHYLRFRLLRIGILEAYENQADSQKVLAMALQARGELESILRYPDAQALLENNELGIEDIKQELDTINKLADKLAGIHNQ